VKASGAPPSGGDWWQDERGKWQKGSRPEGVAGAPAGSPTRLDQIIEQLGHLDGASKFLGRREIRELPSILWEDEDVEKLIQGTYGGSSGVLVATNKRLVFVDKGIAKLRVEDFPYDKVTSIQYKTGLLMGTITIFASGNRAEIQNVVKESCKDFADYVRARVTSATAHASHPPPPATVSEPPIDVLGQLERLGKLREQGILTEEEFSLQKARILGA